MSFRHKAFPHLTGCIQRLSPVDEASGLCFHRSVALLLDLPSGEVCVGTLRGVGEEEFRANPTLSPTPFIHCWVERGEQLFAPTTIEAADNNLIGFLRAEYYAQNEVRDVYRLNRRDIVRLSKQYGWGAYFLKGKPMSFHVPVGKVILEAAKVPHGISARGGVVPPGVELPEYAR